LRLQKKGAVDADLAINHRLANWRPNDGPQKNRRSGLLSAYTAIFPMHNAAEKRVDNGASPWISMCGSHGAFSAQR